MRAASGAIGLRLWLPRLLGPPRSNTALTRGLRGREKATKEGEGCREGKTCWCEVLSEDVVTVTVGKVE